MCEAAANFKASIIAFASAENIDDERGKRRVATLSPKRAADTTLSPKRAADATLSPFFLNLQYKQLNNQNNLILFQQNVAEAAVN